MKKSSVDLITIDLVKDGLEEFIFLIKGVNSDVEKQAMQIKEKLDIVDSVNSKEFESLKIDIDALEKKSNQLLKSMEDSTELNKLIENI